MFILFSFLRSHAQLVPCKEHGHRYHLHRVSGGSDRGGHHVSDLLHSEQLPSIRFVLIAALHGVHWIYGVYRRASSPQWFPTAAKRFFFEGPTGSVNPVNPVVGSRRRKVTPSVSTATTIPTTSNFEQKLKEQFQEQKPMFEISQTVFQFLEQQEKVKSEDPYIRTRWEELIENYMATLFSITDHYATNRKKAIASMLSSFESLACSSQFLLSLDKDQQLNTIDVQLELKSQLERTDADWRSDMKAFREIGNHSILSQPVLPPLKKKQFSSLRFLLRHLIENELISFRDEVYDPDRVHAFVQRIQDQFSQI